MSTITSYQAVRETTRSIGTGSIKLLGPELGHQALGNVGDGNECDFLIRERGGKNWEVATGIYTAATQTLTRATVIASSNGDSLVDFPEGIKEVTLVNRLTPTAIATALGGTPVLADGSVLFTGPVISGGARPENVTSGVFAAAGGAIGAFVGLYGWNGGAELDAYDKAYSSPVDFYLSAKSYNFTTGTGYPNSLTSLDLKVDGSADFSGGKGLKFPTADPHIAGNWWDNAGVLTKSAG